MLVEIMLHRLNKKKKHFDMKKMGKLSGTTFYNKIPVQS